MKDEEVCFEEFIENYPLVTDNKMTELQVLEDIRCVLTEFYNAKLVYDENGLNVKFKNGQIFTVTVKEKK
ncbi:MAG: hypothetical protein K2I20_04315 [Clostridia bacterium]|nr:hypothetical protein [Clostridia bacterium]